MEVLAIFKDPITTASATDRLVHHSVILKLNIGSCHMEQAKKNKTEEQILESLPRDLRDLAPTCHPRMTAVTAKVVHYRPDPGLAPTALRSHPSRAEE